MNGNSQENLLNTGAGSAYAPGQELAILFDTSRCTACRGCQVACKMWNNLPSPIEKNASHLEGSYQSPQDINGDTRLIITFHEEEGGPKGVKWAFGRRSCQHCTNPGCMEICPSGAISKDPDTGMVTVDQERCVGCQYCSTACPFDVPRYQPSDGKMNKCTGCPDRIAHGLAPACVTTCQPGALQFGTREEMLALANERLEYLYGKGFEDAVIYGETEMGGLHVIQVLKYGVTAHGQVENPQVNPVTDAINIMKPVVGVAAGATVVGLAAMFMRGIGYKRDEMAYNEQTQDTLDVETGEVLKHGDAQTDLSVSELMKGGRNE